MLKGVFITGTDTAVGKTTFACLLIKALKTKGIDCGVMKPVQCAGNDAYLLKKCAGASEPLSSINPFYSRYPYAPPIAFLRDKIKFSRDKVLKLYAELSGRHKFMLVEGAGGLLAPVTPRYFIADLAKDLGLPLLIVSRSGLGAINHTLLTVEYARRRGLKIQGLVFNCLSKKDTLSQRFNPQIIGKIARLPLLGVIPYKGLSRMKLDIERIIHG